ncbi:MAG TPA: PAS domain-containing sensor histidine kinase [Myxococcota bacterium]|nr:PAS domain-containing sensor histidine kinase [Myxococcota bacterium]
MVLEDDRRSARLRLSWLIRVGELPLWSYAATFMGLSCWLRNGLLLAFSGICASMACTLRWSRMRMTAHPVAVARALAYTLIAQAVLLAPLAPWMWPALLVVPMTAVTLAVPHLEGWALNALIGWAFAATVEIVLWGTWGPPMLPPPPLWLQKMIVAQSCVTWIGMTFWLSGLDSRRLRRLAHAAQTSASDRRIAQEAARAGEERFRRVLESNIMGMMVTDAEGRVTDINGALLRLVGRPRAAVLGAPLLDLMPWRDPHGAPPGAPRDEEPPPFEMEYRAPDGRCVPILVASVYVSRQAKHITFVLDITALKRAETALRLLSDASRSLSERLPDLAPALQRCAALASSALAPCCAVWLRGHEASPSPPPAHAHGTDDLLCSDCGATAPPLADLALTRCEHEDTFTLHEATGLHRLVVAITGRERLLGALVLSAARPFERHQLSLARELAHRIGVACDNARLYAEAQEAVRTRDTFLSIASHELKTPLTPLQLQVKSILRSAAAGPISQDRLLHKTRVIDAQVTRLISLINDLLDISRIASGRLNLHLEPVDLTVVASEVTQRFRPTLNRARSELVFEAAGSITGTWDALRLDQVVTNLLSNAIKYGGGKPIEVRVDGDVDTARLVVRDQGIGIDPSHLSRIFERFERAVSERHYGGLGLGLWIARQIVDSLHGSISVDSRQGAGSTFTVLLPRHEAAETSEDATTPPRGMAVEGPPPP